MAVVDYSLLNKDTQALAVALRYRDKHTHWHSRRVHALSWQMGKQIGLDAPELELLAIAASFHDIGKIGIPDHILFKPGRLEPDERTIMNRHAETGEKIILATSIEGCIEVAEVIRHHHEHFDGDGYPDQLRGETIPIASRIISLNDSYDAMAETRAYHRGRTHAEIMQVIESECGSKHDPWLFKQFAPLIERSEFRAHP
ncbi:HD domain-containing protein [Mariprofundus erugo]|uniref:HD domain-containing protein n=1 Tax=Mariprofundus erugo TaxID=2528639 RepID=A0A5R9GXX0_9PROT|nr:HD domain-containing phosphohydrolase [Mariprofundus erugo]TLS67864.1 HD domain-containing protein [Mariprofundus erugo]